MKSKKLIPVLVVIGVVLAYVNSFRNPFIFDDRWHVVENLRIRQLWPVSEILTHSSRPVVILSLAVNYALGGLNPWGYHVFNVVIHILSALVLYGVVRRTVIWETTARLAGLAALIWAVHPLQTESVTYTIQRAESLMGLFYLLTLYCVIRGHSSSKKFWWQAGAVASCALGMASKEVMVTAPVVVLLYDRVFLTRSWREVLQRRWPVYAGMAATWLLLPLLMAKASADAPGGAVTAGFGYKAITPVQYALTQPGVILHYLRLAFWPDRLCLDYGWGFGWPLVQSADEALPQLIIVSGLLLGTIWALWRKPALGFLGAWFFVILSPTSSFVPIADVAAEHRTYLSLAAVAVLVVLALFRAGRSFGTAAGGVVALALGVATFQRNLAYRSEVAIWQDTVIKCSGNPRAHYNYGVALENASRLPEAIPHYQEALRIKPDYAEAFNNLGNALLQAGKLPEATRDLEQAIRFNPDLAEAHYNLGNALAQSGKPHEAMAHYETALRLKPDYAEVRNNWGIVLSQAGKLEEARTQFELALRIKPNLPEAHNNLGYNLQQAGQLQNAIAHYEQAVNIRPDYVQAMNNLALLLATANREQGGDPSRAVGLAQQVCVLTGEQVPAYLDSLAISCASAGRFGEAVSAAEKAIKLATTTGQPQLASQIGSRLELYKASLVRQHEAVR